MGGPICTACGDGRHFDGTSKPCRGVCLCFCGVSGWKARAEQAEGEVVRAQTEAATVRRAYLHAKSQYDALAAIVRRIGVESVQHWEADEYVALVAGHGVVGGTLSETQANALRAVLAPVPSPSNTEGER